MSFRSQLNQGQSTGPAGVDVDVMPVWRQGITGRGVVVSILDDGVDHTHPDLRDNFVSEAIDYVTPYMGWCPDRKRSGSTIWTFCWKNELHFYSTESVEMMFQSQLSPCNPQKIKKRITKEPVSHVTLNFRPTSPSKKILYFCV